MFTVTVQLRPEVKWFAEQLEMELRKSDRDPEHTDWWFGFGDEGILRRNRAELVKLESTISSFKAVNSNSDEVRLLVIASAVTAASHLLMIASNWRPFPRGEGGTL